MTELSALTALKAFMTNVESHITPSAVGTDFGKAFSALKTEIEKLLGAGTVSAKLPAGTISVSAPPATAQVSGNAQLTPPPIPAVVLPAKQAAAAPIWTSK